LSFEPARCYFVSCREFLGLTLSKSFAARVFSLLSRKA
jgi:hypothetical protein